MSKFLSGLGIDDDHEIIINVDDISYMAIANKILEVHLKSSGEHCQLSTFSLLVMDIETFFKPDPCEGAL